jgi:hypothetical protein
MKKYESWETTRIISEIPVFLKTCSLRIVDSNNYVLEIIFIGT